jgi:hypothetical protein
MEFSCYILTIATFLCLYIYACVCVCVCVCVCIQGCKNLGRQVAVANTFWPVAQNFVGGQCGTRLMSPFCRPEF